MNQRNLVHWRIRQNLLAILLILITVLGLRAQSPYVFETGKDAAILGAGALTLGLSTPIDRRTPPYLAEDIDKLDINKVWGLDRWVCRQWSIPAQNTSDRLLFSSLVLPSTFLINNTTRAEFGEISLLTLETLLLTTGLTNLTKAIFKRPRPLCFNVDVGIDQKLLRRSRYSFFSGHTSLTASMSFMTARIYSDFFPEASGKPYVWAGAIALPALTGYLRIRGGKHYLTDVLVGYLVGAGVGLLVPSLHKL